MKLNLVADYDIMGKRFCVAYAIDASQNLVRLRDLTRLRFPATGGGFISIAPKSLLMCESRKKAEAIEQERTVEYEASGRHYDFSPIDPYAWAKQESEAAK